MGWSPCVISVDPYRYERYDIELLTLIPREVEVVRVRGRDLWHAIQAWRGKQAQSQSSAERDRQVDKNKTALSMRFRARARQVVRKVESNFYLPDSAKLWIRPAVRASVRVCQSKPVNAIWATVGPISAGVVAHQVSQRTGVPYVLDFRDPWGLNYYASEHIPSKFSAAVVRRTMYRIFRGAQAVVFLFDTVAECYQRAYPGALEDKKIHIIPNGYDGSFDEFLVSPGSKCQVLYTGTVSTYRYDTLLEALAILKEAHPAHASQLCVHFVGEGISELQKKVEALDLSEMIKTMPPIPYGEICGLQQEAHAFLVLGRHSERKGHELVAGAKLFEYLKARRPIIGVLPKDETRKILYHVGVPTVADVDSTVEILAVFLQVIQAWEAGALAALLPNRTICQDYSSEKQTAKLIRALNGNEAEQPFYSGMVEVPFSLKGDIGK